MGMKTTFMVQPFERKRGKLAPGRAETTTTGPGAVKKAEALAGRMPGAAALRIVADDETGAVEEAEILGQWGEVPDDFADGLRG